MSGGVRVRHIPKDVTDKKLKIHFSKPENGGGRITKIYFPLFNNDAVIIFENKKVVDSIMKRNHSFDVNQLDIEQLPEHMIFTQLTGSLDAEASVLLQAYQSLRDDMMFGEGIKLSESADGKYKIHGNWFQLEWAWHYIDCFMQQQEVIQHTINQQPQCYASTPQEVDQFENSTSASRHSRRPLSSTDARSGLQQSLAKGERDSGRKKDQTARSYREASPGSYENYEDERRIDPRLCDQMSKHRSYGSHRQDDDSSRREQRHRSHGNYEHSSPASRHQYDDSNDDSELEGKQFEVPMDTMRSMPYPDPNARRDDENNTFREFSGQMSQYGDKTHPDQTDKKIHTDDVSATLKTLSFRDTTGNPDTSNQLQHTADNQRNYQEKDQVQLYADDSLNSSQSSAHSTPPRGSSAPVRQRTSRASPPPGDLGATSGTRLSASNTQASSPSVSKPKAMLKNMPSRYTEDQLLQTFDINGLKVTIYFGDLLIEETEVIVNAANESLEHYGGIAGAISRARGSDMVTDCKRYIKKNGKLKTTEVMHTSGGGRIKADFIVHAAGPMWIMSGTGFKDKFVKQLTKTFLNCLDYTNGRLFMKSIAMPVISSGVYGAPLDICVRCFLNAILLFTHNSSERRVQDVRLVNNDAESTVTSIVLVQTLLAAGVPVLTAEAEEAMKVNDSSLGLNLPPGRREVDFSKTLPSRSSFDMLQHSLSVNPTNLLHTSPVQSMRDSQRQSEPVSQTACRASPDTADTDRYSVSSKTSGGMGHSPGHVSGGLSARLYRSQSDDKASPLKRESDLSRTFTAGLRSPSKYEGKSGFGRSSASPSRDTNWDLEKMRQQLLTGDNVKPKSSKQQASSSLTGRADEEDERYPRQRSSNSLHDMSGDSTGSEAAMRSLPADRSQSYREKFLGASGETEDKLDICAICLNQVQNPRELQCKHVFCTPCIQDHFKKSRQSCPTCGKLFGKVVGDQPEAGRMTYVVDRNKSLPGYEDEDGMIIITYTFPDGKQESCHPNPGQRYKGITRSAYLPNSSEGREILRLLRKAFESKLVFTIGDSKTTGHSGVLTWNDIHHKTNMTGGSSRFGYPDPSYLKRVRQELADKGITSTR